jgi:hypothetical protein
MNAQPINVESIVKPKVPNGRGWEQIKNHMTRQLDALGGYPNQTWYHLQTGLLAISAVEVATDPGQPSLGPEYHLSISACGNRCSAADALWVLAQFDLTDAKEDNHVPSGKVRNFWRPVADGLSGYECHCVGEEPAMREDKGDYVWRGVTR